MVQSMWTVDILHMNSNVFMSAHKPKYKCTWRDTFRCSLIQLLKRSRSTLRSHTYWKNYKGSYDEAWLQSKSPAYCVSFQPDLHFVSYYSTYGCRGSIICRHSFSSNLYDETMVLLSFKYQLVFNTSFMICLEKVSVVLD